MTERVVANSFGQVVVWSDGAVITPSGRSWINDTKVSLQSSQAIVRYHDQWDTTLVVLALVFAPFTCFLSLLLLLLAKPTATYTEVVDSVIVSSPTYVYVAQGINGAAFVAWAASWKQQFDAPS